MDRKDQFGPDLWKVALGLTAGLVSLFINKAAASADLHFAESIKDLSFGAMGVLGALFGRELLKRIQAFFNENPISRVKQDKSESKARN